MNFVGSFNVYRWTQIDRDHEALRPDAALFGDPGITAGAASS
jgi:hypothetical protein